MLEHLKGDAVVEEQPSLAWPVGAGSSRLGVARAPHCLLHRGPSVPGVLGVLHLLFMQTGDRNSRLITLTA